MSIFSEYPHDILFIIFSKLQKVSLHVCSFVNKHMNMHVHEYKKQFGPTWPLLFSEIEQFINKAPTTVEKIANNLRWIIWSSPGGKYNPLEDFSLLEIMKNPMYMHFEILDLFFQNWNCTDTKKAHTIYEFATNIKLLNQNGSIFLYLLEKLQYVSSLNSIFSYAKTSQTGYGVSIPHLYVKAHEELMCSVIKTMPQKIVLHVLDLPVKRSNSLVDVLQSWFSKCLVESNNPVYINSYLRRLKHPRRVEVYKHWIRECIMTSKKELLEFLFHHQQRYGINLHIGIYIQSCFEYRPYPFDIVTIIESYYSGYLNTLIKGNCVTEFSKFVHGSAVNFPDQYITFDNPTFFTSFFTCINETHFEYLRKKVDALGDNITDKCIFQIICSAFSVDHGFNTIYKHFKDYVHRNIIFITALMVMTNAYHNMESLTLLFTHKETISKVFTLFLNNRKMSTDFKDFAMKMMEQSNGSHIHSFFTKDQIEQIRKRRSIITFSLRSPNVIDLYSGYKTLLHFQHELKPLLV